MRTRRLGRGYCREAPLLRHHGARHFLLFLHAVTATADKSSKTGELARRFSFDEAAVPPARPCSPRSRAEPNSG